MAAHYDYCFRMQFAVTCKGTIEKTRTVKKLMILIPMDKKL